MKRILIATDDEATNTALSDTLSQYEVHICNTGIDALKMLETLQPDILILDLMIPTMDGLTVLRKSKFRPRAIVARTNLITADVLRSAADVGVQAITLVPCTIRHIIDLMDALIEKVPSAGV